MSIFYVINQSLRQLRQSIQYRLIIHISHHILSIKIRFKNRNNTLCIKIYTCTSLPFSTKQFKSFEKQNSHLQIEIEIWRSSQPDFITNTAFEGYSKNIPNYPNSIHRWIATRFLAKSKFFSHYIQLPAAVTRVIKQVSDDRKKIALSLCVRRETTRRRASTRAAVVATHTRFTTGKQRRRVVWRWGPFARR